VLNELTRFERFTVFKPPALPEVFDFGAAIPTAEGVSYSSYPYSASEKMETGFALGVAVGYAFKNNLRIEGELAYQGNKATYAESYMGDEYYSDSENIHTLMGLINSYYDFKNSSDFTPYIGAGIGVGGFVNEGASEVIGAAFAYQVGGGIDYSITNKISVGVKYRYMGLANEIINNSIGNSEVASHNIYAGARFYF